MILSNIIRIPYKKKKRKRTKRNPRQSKEIRKTKKESLWQSKNYKETSIKNYGDTYNLFDCGEEFDCTNDMITESKSISNTESFKKRDVEGKDEVSIQNKRRRTTNTPIVEAYPLLTKMKVKDLNFTDGKSHWGHEFNVTKNELFQNSILGRSIELKSEIYGFMRMDDLNISLASWEKSLVMSFEKVESLNKRCWLISNVEGYSEFILNGENHLHEFIIDLPIKIFVDFDCKCKKEDVERFDTISRRAIRLFKDEYFKLMKYVYKINITNKDSDWILLNSSGTDDKDEVKSEKISYHLIGNHSIDGIPVYFRNIDHSMNILRKVKYKIPYFMKKVVELDENFTLHKSLRTYGSCSRRSEHRCFYRDGANKTFNNEDFEKSILQLHGRIKVYSHIEGIKNTSLLQSYWRVDAFPPISKTVFGESFNVKYQSNGNANRSKDVIVINPRKRARGFTRNTKSNWKTIPKADYVELCLKIIKKYLGFLNKYVKTIRVRNRNLNFNFLKDSIIESFGIDRIRKEGTGERCILIGLSGKSCFINNYRHTHKTGRNIIINFDSNYICLTCQGCKKTDRVSFCRFGITRSLDRVKLRKYINLLKKSLYS